MRDYTTAFNKEGYILYSLFVLGMSELDEIYDSYNKAFRTKDSRTNKHRFKKSYDAMIEKLNEKNDFSSASNLSFNSIKNTDKNINKNINKKTEEKSKKIEPEKETKIEAKSGEIFDEIFQDNDVLLVHGNTVYKNDDDIVCYFKSNNTIVDEIETTRMRLVNKLLRHSLLNDNDELALKLKEISIEEDRYGIRGIEGIKVEEIGLVERDTRLADALFDCSKENPFKLIREWEKGSGTKQYIEKELEDIAEEYSEKFKIDKMDIHKTIDEAITNWSYPKEHVRTRSPSFDFDSPVFFKTRERVSQEEELEMSATEVTEYLRTWDIELFNEVIAIVSNPKNQKDIALFQKMLRNTNTPIYELLTRRMDSNIRNYEKTHSVKAMVKRNLSQARWIIEYNFKITDSKISFVRECLEKQGVTQS